MSDFDYGQLKPNGQYERYPTSVRLKPDGTPDYVQPHRNRYIHTVCGAVTTCSPDISLTYATNPGYYGRTFCIGCRDHFPLDQFLWDSDKTRMCDITPLGTEKG